MGALKGLTSRRGCALKLLRKGRVPLQLKLSSIDTAFYENTWKRNGRTLYLSPPAGGQKIKIYTLPKPITTALIRLETNTLQLHPFCLRQVSWDLSWGRYRSITSKTTIHTVFTAALQPLSHQRHSVPPWYYVHIHKATLHTCHTIRDASILYPCTIQIHNHYGRGCKYSTIL